MPNKILEALYKRQAALHNGLGAQGRQLGAQGRQLDDMALANQNLAQFITAEVVRSSQNPLGFGIDDLPALRVPKWLVVDIDFEHDDTAQKENSTNIETNGAFVVTDITLLWHITDTDNDHFVGTATDYTGRIIPASAYPIIAKFGASADPFQTKMSEISDIPEFNIQVAVGGLGYSWTGAPLPAQAFYSENRPGPIGCPGWFNARDAINIKASPYSGRAVPHDGTLKWIATGYQLIGIDDVGNAIQALNNRALEGINQSKKIFPGG